MLLEVVNNVLKCVFVCVCVCWYARETFLWFTKKTKEEKNR